MTMIDGMATLVISSANNPAYYVGEVLGLQPDWSADKGDPRPRSGDTGNEPIRRRVYDTSVWVLEVDSNPATKMAIAEDESKGFATLQVLVDRLLGRGPALAQLRLDYTVELTWYGTAGGPQAGFVLPTKLIADLAELGLDVTCTVYAHDDTSVRPGLHINDNPTAPGTLDLTQPKRPKEPELSDDVVAQLIEQQLLEQRLADQ
ncbi:MAG TPA: hypothetical protein VGF80_15665 [Galbitalea sp.]|jgi:hypothetical protein